MPFLHDWSFWGTVAGIVATVVFGIWAVALAKSRKYPGEITYFRERTIRLFSDVTGNLPQITVSYKGQPAGKNLSLLRAFIVNTGRKDISKEMIEQPLTIQLDEGYRWLEASAKGSWDGDEHAEITDPRTVAFSWPLLRCSEFLRFESLIEVRENNDWRPAVSVHHRIADTAKVKVTGVPSKPKADWRELLSPALVGIVGCGSFIAALIQGKGPVNSLIIGIGVFTFGIAAISMLVILTFTRKLQRIRKLLKLD